jgi:hypothetical protein
MQVRKAMIELYRWLFKNLNLRSKFSSIAFLRLLSEHVVAMLVYPTHKYANARFVALHYVQIMSVPRKIQLELLIVFVDGEKAFCTST